ANGKVSVTTVSPTLARGIALLVLRTGFLPSIYTKKTSGLGTIQGRLVRQTPAQYAVVWYSNPAIVRRAVPTADNYLVPLRGIDAAPNDGDVDNMEDVDEQTYLAGFLAVRS